MMTKQEFDFCKNIINETIEIINDRTESEGIREILRNELLGIKAEINRLILKYERV